MTGHEAAWMADVLTVLVFGFPVVAAAAALAGTLSHFMRWERGERPAFYEAAVSPLVTVIVPVHDDGKALADTLKSVASLDYPCLEIVIADDASGEDTVDRAVGTLAGDERVRVVRKTVAEGRVMAVADALPVTHGELVLVVAPGTCPDPRILTWMVPHFRSPRVAAVLGDRLPDAGNTAGARGQLLWSGVASLFHRLGRVWGRFLPLAPSVALYRRASLVDVALWDPAADAPNVDLAWRLQQRFYELRYEPRAILFEPAPVGVFGWTRRALRHSAALGSVLHRADAQWRDRRYRRTWPMLAGIALAPLWAYGLLAAIGSTLTATILTGSPLLLASSGLTAGLASAWLLGILGTGLLRRHCGALPVSLLGMGLLAPVWGLMLAAVWIVGFPRGRSDRPAATVVTPAHEAGAPESTMSDAA